MSTLTEPVLTMESALKILVIMGSPRKGNTYRGYEQVREAMEASGPVAFEYLMLGQRNLLSCRGCFLCIAKGESWCPVNDKTSEIEQKMLAADGVIFASPVYGMNVTGLMKTFIDRFSYLFHRPRFFDKKAFLLTSTGSVGTREVLSYLRMVAGVWGFDVAGEAGLITPPGNVPEYRKRKNAQLLKKTGSGFYDAIRSARRRSPALRDVIIFHAQRGSFGELERAAPVDYRYWKEKGGLEPGVRYFVNVPVNPVYTAVGLMVEGLARRQIRKDIAAPG